MSECLLNRLFRIEIRVAPGCGRHRALPPCLPGSVLICLLAFLLSSISQVNAKVRLGSGQGLIVKREFSAVSVGGTITEKRRFAPACLGTHRYRQSLAATTIPCAPWVSLASLRLGLFNHYGGKAHSQHCESQFDNYPRSHELNNVCGSDDLLRRIILS